MPRRRKGDTAGDTTAVSPLEGHPVVVSAGKASYAARGLRILINDIETTPAAKASALRTLAEMEGRIGRHQQAPPDRTASQRVSALARADLERELERLRTLCGVSPALTR